MRNIILVMTFSGTLVAMLYYLISFLMKQRFGVWARKVMVRISILFFIIPFPIFKYLALRYLYALIPSLNENSRILSLTQKYMVYVNPDQVVLSKDELYMKIVYVCCIVLVFAALIYEIIKLLKLKKIIRNHSWDMAKQEENRLEQLSQKAGMRQKVKFVKSNIVSQPFATGIFRPLVVLPENFHVEEKTENDIIRHELAHIQFGDVFWNLLGIAAVILHRFNPFSYLMVQSLREINEYRCDQIATGGLSQQDKMKYCLALITVAESQKTTESGAAVCFSILKKNRMRRRLDYIMNQKKESKVLGMICAAVVSILAFGTGFLYNTPLMIYADDTDMGEWDSGEYYDEGVSGLYGEPIIYDDSFVDEQGNIYEIRDESLKVVCNHNFTNGTTKIHTKKAGGGCVIKYYESKRCSYCNKVIKGDLISTQTFEKCPH